MGELAPAKQMVVLC